jgi:hypothetical protein
MPGKTVRTFSLQFCSITVSTLPALTGFAEGDALTLEYPNDDFEAQESSDGEVIWVQKHNSNMDGMIRLGQGNSLISLLRQLHQASLDAGGLSYQFSATNLKSPDESVTGLLVFKKHIPIKWGDTAQPAEVPFGLTVTSIAGGAITPS